MFRRLFKLVRKILIWYFIITIGLVILYRFVRPPITPLMVIRLAEQAANGQKLKLHKEWVPLDKISPAMPLAVISSEDQRFYDHWGFDIIQLRKAIKERETKHRIRGASTITQQTAKNLFLWPGKSYIRKGFEAYFTVLMELFWPKDRILEVYLNIIETGHGIYGVQAASEHYFHKPASKLSRGQAALIAAVLPNPRRWSPAHPDAYIRGREGWILTQMTHLGTWPFKDDERDN